MSVYDFKLKMNNGEELGLDQYKGQVLLVVNTASKCGFTPQYEGLQDLYDKYKGQGLEIVGVPCNQFFAQEPGGDEEISEFCKLNYGVNFKIASKADVRDENKLPLFSYLIEKAPYKGLDESTQLYQILADKMPHLLEGDEIKWNFTKFLIGKDGEVVARFEPTVEPKEMETAIEAELAK